MVKINVSCNSTLEELRISSGSEVTIVGRLNFHDLARIVAAGCTLIAVVLSLYLVSQHARNYTKPREQRHIIRILFMVPVYALSSLFQIQWYWHAIYFQVISDCYEAFAIASFFALLCHYVAPDLHAQKAFFRHMQPVKPWVWPLSWAARCCGGTRKGPWRTPASGLTWFNIIWIGIYHYCFIRVAMTISAVVSQYFHKYCESSNSPVFGHIWIIVLNALAVTIAMYCVIQFYFQLREPLAEHKPFLKVLAIKLVIFLSFWQASAISVGTSTLHIVHPNKYLAYPDIKVGIPALLLCVEMAIFAILHLWAFPYAPYRPTAKRTFYPAPDPRVPSPLPVENVHHAPSGGFLGFSAIFDALNLWDFVKAFGRGVRWLFCGVRRRKDDVSYKLGLEDLSGAGAGGLPPGAKSTDHLPVANQFRRSTFLTPGYQPSHGVSGGTGGAGGGVGDESAGLMEHAQPNPEQAHTYNPSARLNPFQEQYDPPTAYAGAQGGYHHVVPPGSPHQPHGASQGGVYQPYDAHPATTAYQPYDTPAHGSTYQAYGEEDFAYDPHGRQGTQPPGQESGTTQWGAR